MCVRFCLVKEVVCCVQSLLEKEDDQVQKSWLLASEMHFYLIIKESKYIQHTYNEIICGLCVVSKRPTVFSVLSNNQVHPGTVLIKTCMKFYYYLLYCCFVGVLGKCRKKTLTSDIEFFLTEHLP